MFTPEMIVRVTLSATSQHDATRRDATRRRSVVQTIWGSTLAIAIGFRNATRCGEEKAREQDVD
jgi:hypothetical protein